MKLSPRMRWTMLAAALSATVAASIWVSDTPDPEVVVARPSKAGAGGIAQQSKAGTLAWDKLPKRSLEDRPAADAFPTRTWFVPPPPPKPLPPPPAAPPPLPYTYFGKLQEGSKLTIFIAKQDQNYAIKAGDVLDGQYRVDSVTAQSVVFTYLPLNMQQTLVIGGVN